ncbi:hypothetical protein [Dyadobacter sp. 32]|uniref:hypothetical protein n=1 Tax=Dyadobacter sp. 32 TaxID=538966 RepID=UPI0011EFA1BF
MMKLFTISLWLAASCGNAQDFPVPDQPDLEKAVDRYFSSQLQTQLIELSQTKRFRWLSYLPSPGYSPFAGGFTMSMNLSAPLQEIRLNHATKTRSEAIRQQSAAQATDLKNSLQSDRLTILNRIAEYEARKVLDSLNRLAAELSARKYASNEITPTEYISASKGFNEYLNSRQKEQNAIHEAINNLLYKAKMDVPASNAHLNNLTHK